MVAAHGQTAAEVVTEAEFLAGFIALRLLRDPARATRHFTALDRASQAAITQGRAHYWLGRAAEAAGADGRPHFRRAAAWSTTFYGQMAALHLNEARAVRDGRIRDQRDPGWTQEMVLAYGGREVVRAAVWLIAWGDAPRARAFLLRMDEIAPVPAERSLTAAFALRVGLPDTAVFVARRIGRDGGMLAESGWPMPFAPPEDFDAAVALGVMRQESSFDIGAVSSSGARGLMQLMPFTARDVARKLGIATSLPALTSDTQHNMRLGTTYLRDMLARFGGSLPLAVAAYNAGPSRVDRWLADLGDPRTGDPAMLDWIERIPFNETRNYVQRVLENIVIYRVRRGEGAETLSLGWEGVR
jgi:soluble lytic murein transglycosylase